jgi:hypothetical protein
MPYAALAQRVDLWRIFLRRDDSSHLEKFYHMELFAMTAWTFFYANSIPSHFGAPDKKKFVHGLPREKKLGP